MKGETRYEVSALLLVGKAAAKPFAQFFRLRDC